MQEQIVTDQDYKPLPEASPRERFAAELTRNYTELFQTPDYAAAAAMHTPSVLAWIMADGLINGTASKDGKGVQRTCKALGIAHTYKAIRAFLAA